MLCLSCNFEAPEERSFYCVDCDFCVCGACFLETHRNHEPKNCVEYIEQRHQQLLNELDEVKIKHGKLQETLSNAEVLEHDVNAIKELKARFNPIEEGSVGETLEFVRRNLSTPPTKLQDLESVSMQVTSVSKNMKLMVEAVTSLFGDLAKRIELLHLEAAKANGVAVDDRQANVVGAEPAHSAIVPTHADGAGERVSLQESGAKLSAEGPPETVPKDNRKLMKDIVLTVKPPQKVKYAEVYDNKPISNLQYVIKDSRGGLPPIQFEELFTKIIKPLPQLADALRSLHLRYPFRKAEPRLCAQYSESIRDGISGCINLESLFTDGIVSKMFASDYGSTLARLTNLKRLGTIAYAENNPIHIRYPEQLEMLIVDKYQGGAWFTCPKLKSIALITDERHPYDSDTLLSAIEVMPQLRQILLSHSTIKRDSIEKAIAAQKDLKIGLCRNMPPHSVSDGQFPEAKIYPTNVLIHDVYVEFFYGRGFWSF